MLALLAPVCYVGPLPLRPWRVERSVRGETYCVWQRHRSASGLSQQMTSWVLLGRRCSSPCSHSIVLGSSCVFKIKKTMMWSPPFSGDICKASSVGFPTATPPPLTLWFQSPRRGHCELSNRIKSAFLIWLKSSSSSARLLLLFEFWTPEARVQNW